MTSAHPLRPSRADLRTLAGLAVPVVFVQLGLMAMAVVDTMIVGRLSATALAGVAVANIYLFGLGGFGLGVLMSLDPVVSQAFGARDEAAVARALQRGIVMAVVLGVLAALSFIPVRAALTALGQAPEIIDAAVPYLQVQWPSMFAFFLGIALRQTLQALGHLRPIVIATAVANVVNGFLCWGLVFGHGGLPRLGILGAGIATTFARWLMVLLVLALAWRDLRPRLAWRRDTLHLAPLLRMLRIGLPIGLQVELEYGLFATVGLMMGHVGPIAAGAHQIALNLASLTFMVPLGVSSAGSVLVGRAVGAGDATAARRSGVAALVTGAGFMTLSASLFLLVPRALARAYTPDPAVVALAAALIPIAGMFQVFDGLQVVSIGVLRGVGDTRTPMIVNAIGYWGCALPLSLWLGFGLGWGPRGLWWGLVFGLMVVAAILLTRVRRRLWGRLERLRVDEGAEAIGA
jgi:MATE family multidrug resistance protein